MGDLIVTVVEWTIQLNILKNVYNFVFHYWAVNLLILLYNIKSYRFKKLINVH